MPPVHIVLIVFIPLFCKYRSLFRTDRLGKLFGFVLTHACRYIVNMLTEAF